MCACTYTYSHALQSVFKSYFKSCNDVHHLLFHEEIMTLLEINYGSAGLNHRSERFGE